MATSPWNVPLHGVHVQSVVKVNAASSGKKTDVLASRNGVGIVRGAGPVPAAGDNFEVDFVFNVEAETSDIFDRTILPLVRRVVQGYHAACIMLGTTTSGKLDTLHGARGRTGVLQLAAEVRGSALLCDAHTPARKLPPAEEQLDTS